MRISKQMLSKYLLAGNKTDLRGLIKLVNRLSLAVLFSFKILTANAQCKIFSSTIDEVKSLYLSTAEFEKV